VFDGLRRHEGDDIRVASIRGFLEGGDDLPPECEEKGTKRERRRLPDFIEGAEVAAARSRLDAPSGSSYDGAEPSAAGDWDQFLALRDGREDINLYRIIAQLVRATEHFRRGVTIPAHQVLELIVSELPQPSDREQSVQKAWTLLRKCGAEDDTLSKSYLRLIERLGNVKFGDIDIVEQMRQVVNRWLTKFDRALSIKDGQNYPPGADPPERVWNKDCPCQREKPPPPTASDGTASQSEQPSFAETIHNSEDAMFAALRTNNVQAVVDEFRFLEMTGAQIATILRWLTQQWNAIPLKYQQVITAGKFIPQVPNTSDTSLEEREAEEALRYSEYWRGEAEVFLKLRSVPLLFIGLSQKTTGEVCAELVKATGADTHAVDRAVADNREDAPFRLAALTREPEAYLRVLDQLGPVGEDETGANGLASPDLTALSAFYWRHVVIPSTIGHILLMKDTADFHIAHHLRFLGLFRRGGQLRPANPEDADYEAYFCSTRP
jgi:hypothetical protein